MNRFINTVRIILTGLLTLGIVIYAILVLFYALGWWQRATDLLTSAPRAYMFALPICAIAAFGVVGLLQSLATGDKPADEKLSFTAFGLEFTGPAGPVTLWVVVYLVLVCSMRLVDSSGSKAESQQGATATIAAPK
jgi:hypothetical protein